MMPKRMIAGFLMGLSLAMAPAGAQEKRVSTFAVGEQSFHWDLPVRYCLPVGNDAAVSSAIDKADKQNVTLLTAVSCEGTNHFEHYVLFKTPATALLASIGRPQMLASLGAEFDKPELIASLNSGKVDETVKKGLAEGAGIDVNVQSSFAPMGRDDTCAYLGGQSNYAAPDGTSARVAFVACLTVVKQKVLTLIVYERFVDAGTIAKLVPQAKAIGQSLIAQNE